MVGNCSLFIYNFFQEKNSKWKPGLANIVCKKCFLFRVEINKKNITETYVYICLTDNRSTGVCCGPRNPSKWEADIWGWLEVRRSAILQYTVNQHPHWACRQYGHSGGTWGWLGVERWQLCLLDTFRSANWHRRAAVGHWVSLCVCSVVGWLVVYQLGICTISIL